MSADGTISEARTLLDLPDARVLHGSWQQLAAQVERVDCLIVDAPYSERTHSGHDNGVARAGRVM